MKKMVLVLAVMAGLLALAPAAEAQTDPFDSLASRRTDGALVYRDSNHDGVVRPDINRAQGLAHALYVTGADEVILNIPPESATSVRTAALLADCTKKYGVSSNEANWWSASNVKYTFRWSLGIDYNDVGCNGFGAGDDSRYSAGLYALREGASTGAYFRNDNASWARFDYYYPNCVGACIKESASRNWGWSAHQADGANTYLGTWHSMATERWYNAGSQYLQAKFTYVTPDHTTNVYCGDSDESGINGGVLTGYNPTVC